MRSWWWKILCFILVGFTVLGGFLMPVPRLDILNETIRNLYFHVPMWFTMILLFAGAFYYSIKYLRTGNLKDDVYALQHHRYAHRYGVGAIYLGGGVEQRP